MASTRLNITIDGAGPYGFRLAKGENNRLIVAKLRRQSKAEDAGLQEGDVVLGINGYSCQNMTHSMAVGLLENTEHTLSLFVLRGGNEVSDVSNAYNEASSLGLRPISPRSVPPPRRLPPPPTVTETGTLIIDQPAFSRIQRFQQYKVLETLPAPTAAPPAPIQIPAPAPAPVAAPAPARPSSSTVKTYFTAQLQDGVTGRDTGIHFPEITVPVVRTPTVVGRAGERKGPRPWTGSGYETEPVDGIEAEYDSLDVPAPAPGPAPVPSFTVSQNVQVSGKVADRDGEKPWMWRPRSVTPRREERAWSEPKWQENYSRWKEDAEDRRDGGADDHQPSGVDEDGNGIPRWALPVRSDYDWRKFYEYLPLEIRLLMADDSYQDGPDALRKKKIYSDSSFYDDPGHKYPTIEEQIKMARKVAQSLTAAGNRAARGQRMFMRRKEKADRWTIDHPSYTSPIRLTPRKTYDAVSDSESEVPYYTPAPWAKSGPALRQNIIQPSKVGPAPWARRSEPEVAPTYAPSPAPPAPPLPSTKWQPSWQKEEEEPSGKAPTSAVGDQLSRLATHTGNLPPQIAFGLAADLRQMKGKGGRMYAKRRARAVAEEGLVEGSNPDMMEKIASSYVPPKAPAAAAETRTLQTTVSDQVDNYANEPPSASRLLEKIERSRVQWEWPATSGSDEFAYTSQVDSLPQPRVKAAVTQVDSTAKSRGGFRPVNFRTTNVSEGYVSAVQGISEF